MAGAVASALAKASVYPIDTVVTRLQVQKQFKGEKETPSAASDADAEYKSLLDAANKIWKNEGGLNAFYAGCWADVGKHVVDAFLFFLAYNALQNRLLKAEKSKSLPVYKDFGVGIVAGCFSKAFTTPIQNIVTRQQTAALIAARNPSSSNEKGGSIKDVFLEIHRNRGVAGFWAGYSAAVVMTLNPAITFAVDNILRGLIPQKHKDKPQLTFFLAALSKAIATGVMYPVQLAKSRAITSSSSPAEGKGDSKLADPEKADTTAEAAERKVKQKSWQALRLLEGQIALFKSLLKIYRTEGVQGMYSGIEGDILKGFLQHGLTMMIKENVHGGVIQLYYVLLKLTKRWPDELAKVRDNAASVAMDVQERAENVGVTVVEGAKSLSKKVTEN